MTTKKVQPKKSRTLFVVTNAEGDDAYVYRSIPMVNKEIDESDAEYLAVFEVKVMATYDVRAPTECELIPSDVDKSLAWLEIK